LLSCPSMKDPSIHPSIHPSIYRYIPRPPLCQSTCCRTSLLLIQIITAVAPVGFSGHDESDFIHAGA
jgi:hypothetical protein